MLKEITSKTLNAAARKVYFIITCLRKYTTLILIYLNIEKLNLQIHDLKELIELITWILVESSKLNVKKKIFKGFRIFFLLSNLF